MKLQNKSMDISSLFGLKPSEAERLEFIRKETVEFFYHTQGLDKISGGFVRASIEDMYEDTIEISVEYGYLDDDGSQTFTDILELPLSILKDISLPVRDIVMGMVNTCDFGEISL